jgi:membrane fusion protein, adhesin transport system
MNALDELATGHPLPTWRMLAWPIMIFLSILIAWALLAELEEVSVALGEVVPKGKIRVVQHLEGGIVEEIYVKEGDTVRADAPLLRLNLAAGGVNREELLVRLDGQVLAQSRHKAEANGTEIKFPKNIADRRPLQVTAEMRNFGARKRELASTISVLRAQIRQKQLEVSELQARHKATKNNLALAKERFKLSKSLLTQGLTPKIEHLQLEAEVGSLTGDMESVVASIPRARAAVAEVRERLKEEGSRFRREAQEEQGKAEQAIARIRTLLTEATEQKGRTEIKSPIEGIVKNMRYNTLGGVVKAGEPIMEIVPTGESLVIDARLKPTDRGYVELGQAAVVKISTYDFVRYGGLDGKVILLGSDSSTDEDGELYFQVIVQTEKTYLGSVEGSLPIVPGMEATVDIHTGEKTVMDYLIKPVLKLRHEAFRER